MRWVDAVKQWNAEHNKGKYCVPRKGSPEHAQVVALMGKKIETPAAAESAPPAKMPRRTIKLSKAGYVAATEGKKLAEIGEKITKAQAKKRILKILKANLTKMKAIEKTKSDIEGLDVIENGMTANPKRIPVEVMLAEFITTGLQIRAGKTPEPKIYFLAELDAGGMYDDFDRGDQLYDVLKKVAPKFLRDGMEFGHSYLGDTKRAKKVFGKEAVADALDRYNEARLNYEETEEEEPLGEDDVYYHFTTITQERDGYTDESPIKKTYYLSDDFKRELPGLLRLVKRKPFDPSKDMESVD